MKFVAVTLCVLITGCIHTPPPPQEAPSLDAGEDPALRDLSRDASQDEPGEPDAVPRRDLPADTRADTADAARDVARDPDAAPDTGPPDVPDEPCPPGIFCVDSFPHTHDWNTRLSVARSLNGYSCDPEANESGPEVVYRVRVPEAGFLSVAVHDEDADIDVHILSAPRADACLARGHHQAAIDAEPGIYWIVADTWTDEAREHVGEYRLDIGLYVPSRGPCGLQAGEMERVRDNGDHLEMPATGPIVMEAHLVTQEEPPPYPSTPTEELTAHYELSQRTTGFVMYRDQNWAPLEGGDFYGAGIGSPTLFPTAHEAWYVNMYWTREARPDRGDRMILRQPGTSRAVVVAAGYETGPGNLDHIGGTPEETHFYLGTGHLDNLTLGIATDQALPFGPRVCTD